MHQMAMVLTCLGNRSAGESVLEEYLGATERILGNFQFDTLSTVNCLALSYQ